MPSTETTTGLGDGFHAVVPGFGFMEELDRQVDI
jgi:hypothetical protein